MSDNKSVTQLKFKESIRIEAKQLSSGENQKTKRKRVYNFEFIRCPKGVKIVHKTKLI